VLISGGCHCGNTTFALDWLPEPSEIPARRCTCSFCVKHGGVWTSCPLGTLRVTVQDPTRVTRYEFGTRTAQFHVCQTCGVVPWVSCEIDGHLYAVVCVNTFHGVDVSLLKHSPVNFEGESGATERLSRRRRSWIANVEYREGRR
jgi:hypothetical protein